MKTNYLFLLIFILALFNCSKDDSNEAEAEFENRFNRCFLVKNSTTGARIETANVYLNPRFCGTECAADEVIGYGVTASAGERCFTLTESENEAIKQIVVLKPGYITLEINDPPLDLYELLIEPN
ncbi:hypothetical protein RXV94_00140 [Yeosuana sp. MJ-SS3]|uniref:Uncharacterized protein n=1 Tax=Gilvirhabdus luticola TaxID=3079858 RepID=A0ABU3U2H9_9FLAO|nr:hypothetical protein [Yeosuana sp. MJ-SS3]MDU8884547.1 hypothetical protein [Yeosuana sp. MJ-SS3]